MPMAILHSDNFSSIAADVLLSATAKYATSTQAGSLLICIVGGEVSWQDPPGGAPVTFSPPSTPGFTWTLAASKTTDVEGFAGGTYQAFIAIYFISDAAVMSSSVVTKCATNIDTSDGNVADYNLAFDLIEVSESLAPVSPVDTTAVNQGTVYPISAGNITLSQTDFLLVAANQMDSIASAGPSYTFLDGTGADATAIIQMQYRINLAPGTYPTAFTDGIETTPAAWGCVAVAFSGGNGGPPPPPLPACVPSTGGVMTNGVYVSDLGLFIGPSSALFKSPVPAANMTVNESITEGRNAIIVDFNGSEGLYSRDLEAVLTWPIASPIILDIYQPSIIPMDDDVYDRLSFHFLMTSLGSVGWQHLREINLAYASTADANLLLTFDQWPDINITIPSSGGTEIKQKFVVPANKFKLMEGYLSCAQPLKLWGSDVQFKLGQWGRTDAYRVLKPLVS